MLNNDSVLIAVSKFNSINGCQNINAEWWVTHLYYIADGIATGNTIFNLIAV